MIGVTIRWLILLFVFFQYTRIGLAMRAAASVPDRQGWSVSTPRMIALGLGHGDRHRFDRRHADRAGGVPRAEHDGRVLILRICAAVSRADFAPRPVIGGFLVGIFENLAAPTFPASVTS